MSFPLLTYNFKPVNEIPSPTTKPNAKLHPDNGFRGPAAVFVGVLVGIPIAVAVLDPAFVAGSPERLLASGGLLFTEPLVPLLVAEGAVPSAATVLLLPPVDLHHPINIHSVTCHSVQLTR